MASTEDLPERPKAEEGTSSAPGAAEGQAAPSKNALKKAEKDRIKAEKAAKNAEAERQRKDAADAADTAKHLYGKYTGQEVASRVQLLELTPGQEDKDVAIQARVHNARQQSAKLAFLDLRQETENIQAVVAEGGAHGISRKMISTLGKLNTESLVLVTGQVKEPKEPVHSTTISGLELHVKSCYTIAEAPEQLPMQVKDAMRAPPVGDEPEEPEGEAKGPPNVSMNTRLNNRVLSLRAPADHAIMRINGMITRLFSEFMFDHHFEQIHTPKLVGAATEGGADVFAVTYFNTKAYLSQSPQFFKQMAIANDLQRVFEIGPVFRAENSNTPRHLTEFTGLDFEMEIHKDWTEVIDVAEDLIIFILNEMNKRCKHELSVVKRVYPEAGDFKIPNGRAPRLRFSEGIQMLKEAGIDASDAEDINTTDEKTLGRLVAEKYNTDFYFLTHYPVAARPFYTQLAPDEPHLTLSYDAFMRGQEIVSGAQRVHDPAVLAERMRSKGLDPESEGFKHYVDAFRLGVSSHGGGGFGLNRITMLLLGLPNVRLATMFPRDPNRLAP